MKHLKNITAKNIIETEYDYENHIITVYYKDTLGNEREIKVHFSFLDYHFDGIINDYKCDDGSEESDMVVDYHELIDKNITNSGEVLDLLRTLYENQVSEYLITA